MKIQELIDGISEAIFGRFGEAYEIYSGKVEQGLQEPCFLILCLNPSKNRDLGRRFRRLNQFSIQYFPSGASVHEECAEVLEQLFDCLKDITVSGRIVHGTDLSGAVTDDVLTLTVSYDGFELEEQQDTYMETVSIDAGAKG